jgi:MHS family proline/betaine transporter-like MFS transporter
LLQVARDHAQKLLIGIGFSTLWAVCVYTLVIFMPVFVQRTLHFEARQAFFASLIGNCFMAAACIYTGALSDRFGRRVIVLSGALMLLVGVYPLLAWLSTSHTTTTLVLVQTAFCLMVALFAGVAPAALSELFPTRVRSTGMSLSYNVAVTVFGGFAPAILVWLTGRTGATLAPAAYVMAAAVVALIAIGCLPGRMQTPLPEAAQLAARADHVDRARGGVD